MSAEATEVTQQVANTQATEQTQQTEQVTQQTTTEQAANAPAFDLQNEVKRWAGEDKAKLNQLRYKSVDDVFEALANAKQKIREGSLVKRPGESATPEEVSAYREALGVPETPEGYLEKLPDGLVIGEADKPIFDSFLAAIHAKNADPAVAQEAVKWYYDFQQQQEAALVEANDQAKTKAEDLLMGKWGADFKVNTNLISNVVAMMPKELVGEGEEPGPLFQAHMEDGTQLMNHPAMLEWLVKIGRDIHAPTTALTQGNDPGGVAIESRIAELTKMSGNHDGPYWKGPQAEALQAELRSLNEKLAGRK